MRTLLSCSSPHDPCARPRESSAASRTIARGPLHTAVQAGLRDLHRARRLPRTTSNVSAHRRLGEGIVLQELTPLVIGWCPVLPFPPLVARRCCRGCRLSLHSGAYRAELVSAVMSTDSGVGHTARGRGACCTGVARATWREATRDVTRQGGQPVVLWGRAWRGALR